MFVPALLSQLWAAVSVLFAPAAPFESLPVHDHSMHHRRVSAAPVPPSNFTCDPVSVSVKTENYYGHPVPHTPFLLYDAKNRILMDWSPKAACTKSVVMFYAHMGLLQGRDWFQSWPHAFRGEYRYKCGFAQVGMLMDPSWKRFKVVRNPYERIVSVYLHMMRHQTHFHANPPIVEPSLLSFAGFVDVLEQEALRDEHVLYGGELCGGHARHQHYKYEIDAHRGLIPAPYDYFIHTEHAQEELDQMVSSWGERGPRFNFSLYPDRSDIPRWDNVTFFVAHLPYTVLKTTVPASYRYFYDDALQAKVAKLYHWDLEIYGYNFTFSDRNRTAQKLAHPSPSLRTHPLPVPVPLLPSPLAAT